MAKYTEQLFPDEVQMNLYMCDISESNEPNHYRSDYRHSLSLHQLMITMQCWKSFAGSQP